MLLNANEIPVVLLIFKRKEKIKDIVERLEEIKPKRVYIVADGPRNTKEKKETDACRLAVENNIKWDCQIIKNYSDNNRGVYENIAIGAKWVLEREKHAIFLEDDNLPETTFFEFVKEMLNKYKDNEQILWICGTNYLEEYNNVNGDSYVFTKHMMPCGWATWSNKFLKYYDGNLERIENEDLVKNMRKQYPSKALYKQQIGLAKMEKRRIDSGLKPTSWDYQMEFSIRSNNLLGISPKYNQIQNIGVDDHSIHGGSDRNDEMTHRFTRMKTKKLKFPLKHPNEIIIDDLYEKKVGEIILWPINRRFKKRMRDSLRNLFKLKDDESTYVILDKIIGRKGK